MDTLERLRHRLDVYARIETRTEFGETTYKYMRIRTVWGEILPVYGREETIPGKSVRSDVTHKITLRKNAIREPRNDMFFIFRGQKYKILYSMPHYRRNDLTEFYTRLVVETEDEYGK